MTGLDETVRNYDPDLKDNMWGEKPTDDLNERKRKEIIAAQRERTAG